MWEKNKFHHFWPPSRKILEKFSSGVPPGKNPSDTHANGCDINIRSRSKYEIWCSKKSLTIINNKRNLTENINYDVISRFGLMKKDGINIWDCGLPDVFASEVTGVTFFYSWGCSKKSDFSSCSGTLWKFTLQLLFALRKLEGNVYFASWGKITVRAILPLPNMDKLCHGFSAGKQLVTSCLHCIID